MPRIELLAAVQCAARAINSKHPRPILQNVLIGGGLVAGTDLEKRIECTIPEMCEPFLAPADRLVSILKNASGEKASLTSEGTVVKVKCGRGSWTLPTESVAEYPTWETSDLHAVARLPADQFARAARSVVYATDTESSRYALGGVLIEVRDGNPTWVATDGRRLAMVETETDQAVDDQSVIVPCRLMSIVAGMASGDGSVQIEASKKEIVFSMDGVTVTGLILEGRFPRWLDVVGEPEGEPATIDVRDLLSAVRAARIVTSEQSKGVDLSFDGSQLVLRCRSSEYGESIVKCPVVSGTASATKIDPGFLADFLGSISVEEEPRVDVYAADAISRVLLKCGPYTGVIMPLAADGV